MGSIWEKDVVFPQRETLTGDRTTDVLVIGGGMAGILCARVLRDAGVPTVVLEAQTVASGQTGRTTAKITVQHGAVFPDLIARFGKEKAAQYAQANLEAMARIEERIRNDGIDCDFEKRDALLYGNDEEVLQKHAQAQASLGIRSSLVKSDLPIRNAAYAVKTRDQAQFHPLKFLKAVSEPLTIYERSRVLALEGDRAITRCGSVRARHIVFACHVPFFTFPGLFFAKQKQMRAYVVAVKNAEFPDGMWKSISDNGYSFRKYGDLLLITGQGHLCGENGANSRYEEIREFAMLHFPDCREVARWSAQDGVTGDRAPFIGRIGTNPERYVITGFQKWGMTHSMVAAQQIAGWILSGRQEWEVFDPMRKNLTTTALEATSFARSVKGVAKAAFCPGESGETEVKRESGRIGYHSGKRAAIYRDGEGRETAVSPVCTHMCCRVVYNPDEKSWDCPCHGSRFSADGSVLNGPANRPLEKIGGETSDRSGLVSPPENEGT